MVQDIWMPLVQVIWMPLMQDIWMPLVQDIWMPVLREDGVEEDWVQFGTHYNGCSCVWPCELGHAGACEGHAWEDGHARACSGVWACLYMCVGDLMHLGQMARVSIT